MRNQLTEEEITERDIYLEIENDAIQAIAKFDRHTVDELKDLEAYMSKVVTDEMTTVRHGVEVTVTNDMLMNLTRLNRAWTPKNIQEYWDGLICPLDLTYYADAFGGEEDVS